MKDNQLANLADTLAANHRDGIGKGLTFATARILQWLQEPAQSELLDNENDLFQALNDMEWMPREWWQFIGTPCRSYDPMGRDEDESGKPINPRSCHVCGLPEAAHGE